MVLCIILTLFLLLYIWRYYDLVDDYNELKKLYDDLESELHIVNEEKL